MLFLYLSKLNFSEQLCDAHKVEEISGVEEHNHRLTDLPFGILELLWQKMPETSHLEGIPNTV